MTEQQKPSWFDFFAMKLHAKVQNNPLSNKINAVPYN